MRRALGLACAVAGLWPAGAYAQVIESPFKASYNVRDLGSPPGVPTRYGGLTFLAGDSNTLLIGGEANASTGALYAVPVKRAADGQITGFGNATRYADAANNDGGVAYGPGNVLFLAQWPNNGLGQTRPGSSATDKFIDMNQLGVASSLAALNFVPAGFPGAGSLKLSSYSGGEWYDAAVTPDGTGTFDLTGPPTQIPASTIPGSDGFVYVPAGSSLFDSPSMLVTEYQDSSIGAYELDGDGNPVVSSRRAFMTGFDNAVGATIDPVTKDFLFSTFGGANQVVAVGGFGLAPPPVLGKTVTASVVKGDVRIKLPSSSGGARASQKGGGFVPLTEARTIPVRSILDTRKGTVALRSAKTTAGKTQSGSFTAGVFQVLQSRKEREKGLTELQLKGSAAGFRSCDNARGSATARSALSRRTIRRLRARARGRYRTRGRHSAATVRGTTWTVADRCDGTLTTVKRGKVVVRDFRLRKNVVLTAGKSYLATGR